MQNRNAASSLWARIAAKLNGSHLVRNTFWMFVGQGVRIPLQAVYFVFTARFLGAQGYGAFVGVTALVAILAPFASLGCGNLLIKNVARDPSTFGKCWGKALVVTLMSGVLLLCCALAASVCFLPREIPLVLVVSVAVADLFFSRILDICGQAFQAFQRLGRTSQLMILPNVGRLLLLGGLVFCAPRPTVTLWGYFYLVSVSVSAMVGVALVCRELGRPVLDRTMLLSELKEGFYFSVSLSSQNIYNDIDKTMLTKLATLEAAGIYAAAYRIIDVSFIPIRSVLYACYARFFQSGRSGVTSSLVFAGRILPYATGYSIVISLGLLLLAPFLPVVLGAQFQDAVRALQWLALLPVVKTLHSFAADALTGAGYQGVRTILQVVCAAINVLLMFWLVPTYSWRGAAWASLATDGLLALLLWSAAILYRLREGAVLQVGAFQGEES